MAMQLGEQAGIEHGIGRAGEMYVLRAGHQGARVFFLDEIRKLLVGAVIGVKDTVPRRRYAHGVPARLALMNLQGRSVDARCDQPFNDPDAVFMAHNAEHGDVDAEARETGRRDRRAAADLGAHGVREALFTKPGQAVKAAHDDVDEEIADDHYLPRLLAPHLPKPILN